VREGYGLTEASPIVTTTAFDDVLRPGSIGPPLPGVDVRLVDADGDDVLAGDPGEIWVRGPNVFPGYWHDDETTARVLIADGWLRTGDVAVADDDGYLSLVDRAKDLVIVSGFNVYPAEVESVLAEHPEVAEVAVVGVDDPRTGEALVAFVVSASGRPLTDSTLRAFVAARLARYKVPASFEIVAALPRNSLGKLLRRALDPDPDPNPNS
jgi:long-chain acyl-CoA synthetase